MRTTGTQDWMRRVVTRVLKGKERVYAAWTTFRHVPACKHGECTGLKVKVPQVKGSGLISELERYWSYHLTGVKLD